MMTPSITPNVTPDGGDDDDGLSGGIIAAIIIVCVVAIVIGVGVAIGIWFWLVYIYINTHCVVQTKASQRWCKFGKNFSKILGLLIAYTINLFYSKICTVRNI